MRIFIFLHIAIMFTAVAITIGPTLLLQRIGRTGDVPAIRRSFEQGVVGGTFRTTEMLGRVQDNIEVNMVNGNIRFMAGSSLEGTSVVNATGTEGGVRWNGNVEVMAGADGTNPLGGKLRIGGNNGATFFVNEVAAGEIGRASCRERV